MIRVLLVDDHALITQGLRRAFESTEDLEVVGDAASVAQALALVPKLTPHVCVVDINLGDGSGIELCSRLRAEHPSMGLVVLTMYDGDDHLFGALEAGTSALVLKSAPADEVAAAVRRAATNPTAFTANDLGAAMRRRMQATAVRLTPREKEILLLLSGGKSVAVIAKELYISPSTAKTHMAKLYDKLEAANRTQAVMNAVRLGLLSPQEVAR